MSANPCGHEVKRYYLKMTHSYSPHDLWVGSFNVNTGVLEVRYEHERARGLCFHDRDSAESVKRSLGGGADFNTIEVVEGA